MTETKQLQDEIQKRAMAFLAPLFQRYRLDQDSLESVLKWKSIVLILGNFSSGKSTLINELFGTEIQRTGQSPTDDSFTIITAPDKDLPPRELPGSSLVNDERLPFTAFKQYGEKLAAHLTMKQVASPSLQDMAIIDSPGMLDATTEKDRGYDYPGVVGALARLADLVVLMFDPHKAGTIREVYDTIRSTLPGNSGEDRIIFVMSRIDECDNQADLIRSYGTLCWHLSQMTGRKDIPRIFMTYSPTLARDPEAMAAWHNERNELKERIMAAPTLRVNHILQHIDKQAHELRMITEALTCFSLKGRQIMSNTGRLTAVISLFFFLFTDIIIREITNLPNETLIASAISGTTTWTNLLLPLLGVTTTVALMSLFFTRFQLGKLKKTCGAHPEELVVLDSDYRRQLWGQVKAHVGGLLKETGLKDVLLGHQGNLRKIDRFISGDLQNYYKRAN